MRSERGEGDRKSSGRNEVDAEEEEAGETKA